MKNSSNSNSRTLNNTLNDFTSGTFSGTLKFSSNTANKIAYFDGNKALKSSTACSLVELAYLSGVNSAIQTQLNSKASLASPAFTGIINTPLTASKILVTDSSSNLATTSACTTQELAFVSGVTSAIQTQMNTKAPIANPSFTGYMTINTDAALSTIKIDPVGNASSAGQQSIISHTYYAQGSSVIVYMPSTFGIILPFTDTFIPSSFTRSNSTQTITVSSIPYVTAFSYLTINNPGTYEVEIQFNSANVTPTYNYSLGIMLSTSAPSASLTGTNASNSAYVYATSTDISLRSMSLVTVVGTYKYLYFILSNLSNAKITKSINFTYFIRIKRVY